MSHEHPFTDNRIVVGFLSLHLYSCLFVFKRSEQNKHLSHRWDLSPFYVISEGSAGHQRPLLAKSGQSNS